MARTLPASIAVWMTVVAATGCLSTPEDQGAPAPVSKTVAAEPAGGSQAPDILLISIDSLRADHVGAYGYDRPTTPTIDRLAAAGTVFANAISTTSWTLPSHIAMLTGLYDRAHGVVTPNRTLGQSIPTLAEAFSAAGYRTVGLYSGPFLHSQFGFSRGFDEYLDCTSYHLGAATIANKGKAHGASHNDVTNPYVIWNFLDSLERAGDAPLFYFVHLWDVHYDLIPPPPYDTMFDPDYDGEFSGHDFRHNPKFKKGISKAEFEHVLALYDGEIRYTDATVGLILSALKTKGRLDNTIVVITADHGEEFLEHGRKGHKQTLYREVLRVPLIFYWPGRIPVSRSTTPVSIVDIAPSLLSLAGLPAIPGVSGNVLFTGDGTPVERGAEAILAELFGADGTVLLSTVIDGNLKVLAGSKQRVPVYFDLRADPGEQRPQIAGDSPEGRRLLKSLDEAIARAAARARSTPQDGRSGEHELTDRVSERLRALGYLE